MFGNMWGIWVLVIATFAVSNCMAQIAPEKGHITRCDQFTRSRDCAPWGLTTTNNRQINPAFKYDYDSPIDNCRGVMNNFYFFKLVNFGAALEVSVALRALKGISEVMWNTLAHYHPTATDTLGKLHATPARRQAAAKRTVRNKNVALAYALTRATAHLLPEAKEEAQRVLEALVNPIGLTGSETAANTKTPQGIGNLVASELVAYLKFDGWNSEGNLTPGNPFPFADYSGYQPVNTPTKVTHPLRYQPLTETDTNGYFYTQTHITPQLRDSKVKLWALNRTWVNSRKLVLPWGTGDSLSGQNLAWYKGNVTKVLQDSANLTARKKLLAEFFDAKIVSFGGFERWYAHKNNWCHDQFMVYEQLSSCLHDATILAWKEKIRIDAIRPASAMRYLRSKGMLPAKVKAWGGKRAGYKTASIDPYQWQSYLRTMPHSEYPSGTSCVCEVWTEWTRLFQKTDAINLPLSWDKGCSSVEQGVTPGAGGLSHTFKTIQEVHDTCMQSRAWAGVHFEASLSAGGKVCKGVAAQCFAKVQRLLKGNPN